MICQRVLLISFFSLSLFKLSKLLQVSDFGRQLAEEEDACMSISNAMKKLTGDAKRYKEATENMENK